MKGNKVENCLFIFGSLVLECEVDCKIWLLSDVLVVNLLIDCNVFSEMKILCNVFEYWMY